MFDRMLHMTYHHELIRMMLKNAVLATLISNVIVPLAVAFVYHSFFSYFFLAVWIMLHFMLFIIRLFNAKKLTYSLETQHRLVERHLKEYLLWISLSGLLWGSIAGISVFFVSETYIFIMLSIIFGVTAGSIAALGSIFHAFTLFVTFSTLPFVIALLYSGGMMYLLVSMLILIYLALILKGDYLYYTAFKNYISLKEEVDQLNDSLSNKVEMARKEIESKKSILYRQSRLAQMGEMLSMIAHQWRQPLTAISATSASLELKANLNHLDNDFVIQKTHDISNYVQHLSTTINDFRDFFKHDKEVKETSYDELIESVLGIIKISLDNQNIQLHQKLNCHDTFNTYPNELRQVILNLVKNSEDVLLERKIEDPYIKIITYKKDNKYILEVSDNGGGIPEDIMESIFDPYFSTKHDQNGTGLGLYMSKTIIEEHCSGKINVSNNSEGAVFSIIL